MKVRFIRGVEQARTSLSRCSYGVVLSDLSGHLAHGRARPTGGAATPGTEGQQSQHRSGNHDSLLHEFTPPLPVSESIQSTVAEGNSSNSEFLRSCDVDEMKWQAGIETLPCREFRPRAGAGNRHVELFAFGDQGSDETSSVGPCGASRPWRQSH